MLMKTFNKAEGRAYTHPFCEVIKTEPLSGILVGASIPDITEEIEEW